MALTLIINGEPRLFETLEPGSNLNLLLEVLALKHDRIALEVNGSIAPRASWAGAKLFDDDRLELVHFVGGGANT